MPDSGNTAEPTKKNFLVVYDYETGGVWGLVSARSKQEIQTRYGNLAVVEAVPAWISDDQYRRIVSTSSWDIDDPSPPDWVIVRSADNEPDAG
ncbi:MAG: hypothetical protein ACI8U3_000914 [Brevundimonas sp.]|jgi:hypothetical protein